MLQVRPSEIQEPKDPETVSQDPNQFLSSNTVSSLKNLYIRALTLVKVPF